MYTRHEQSCKHTDPEYQKCKCPKWLAVHPRSGEPRRYSLNTPSWAEGVEIASKTLKGFDPEIAAARKQQGSKERNSKSVLEAINLWLERTRREFGADAAIVKQYRSTFGWVDKDGGVHGSLLGFVEEYNEDHPNEPILAIADMTPLICQQWRDSDWFGDLSPATARQRWGVVRSFFNFLFELGVIPKNPTVTIKAPVASDNFANVPFTNKQFRAIRDSAEWYVDERVVNGERDVYRKRMYAFLELLRNTGMDIGDAVTFQPSVQLTDEEIDGDIIPVLRYRRAKTRVQAIIPLDPKLAQMLRSIPTAPASVADMPFRYKDNLLSSDVHNWSRRICTLIKLADIGQVQLITKEGKPAVDDRGNPITKAPNPKMLRHTAAVGWLVAGHREEAVARMMGHVGTDMIRKHYAPWCRERDAAHIREVLAQSRPSTLTKGKSARSRQHVSVH
jgi:integrase